MPRIDPITGCEVVTIWEFWQKEADEEGNGKTASDVMQNFFTEFDAAAKTEQQETFDNLLNILAECVKSDNELEPEYAMAIPVKIVSKEMISFDRKFGGLDWRAKAVAECDDGQEHCFEIHYYDYASTMIDPGECDWEIAYDKTDTA